MKHRFPKLMRLLASEHSALYDVLPPASAAEIEALEEYLGVPLPASYKDFLHITRGFGFGDFLQFSSGHPFFLQSAPSTEWSFRQKVAARLTPEQRQLSGLADLADRTPSDEMLCFGEYWLEGDGDQVLFEVRSGLCDDEYPVFYYNHDSDTVHKLADSFHDWLESCLPEVVR